MNHRTSLTKTLAALVELNKGIIISPRKMFQSLENRKYIFLVHCIFILSSLITLIESFGIKQNKLNFYQSVNFNKSLSFFNAPIFQWALAYLCFFFFLILIKLCCSIILKHTNTKKLVLYFFSISGIGIMLQIIFFVLKLVLPHILVNLLFFIASLWIFFLSLIALQQSQNTTYTKSFIIYTLSGLPIVLISGFSGLAPFLLWIAT